MATYAGADQETALIVRAERPRQQPEGVQLLNPLAIDHIGLAPGHVLDVMRIDQLDIESPAFEQFEQGYLVDTGRFHGDGGDPTALQPIGQALEIGGERRKLLHRLRISIGRNGDKMAARANIDSSGVEVDALQRRFLGLLLEDRIDFDCHFFLGRQRHALLFFLGVPNKTTCFNFPVENMKSNVFDKNCSRKNRSGTVCCKLKHISQQFC